MEIKKIASCWPSLFFNGIPITDFITKENFIDVKIKNFHTKNYFQIPIQTLDFIFQMCKIAYLSYETAQSSILLVENFYSSRRYRSIEKNIQLVTIGSMFISSKLYDVRPIPLSILHKYSNNIFNNSMVVKTEKLLLEMIGYNFLLRDHLIIDRLSVFLESIRNLIDAEYYYNLYNLSCMIANLLYEDCFFFRNYELNHLSCSIIHSALVIATRRDGKLLITKRLYILTGVKEDEIIKLSLKIIKFCLGKEIFKKYNFG